MNSMRQSGNILKRGNTTGRSNCRRAWGDVGVTSGSRTRASRRMCRRWQWPTHIHRPTVERVLTLDFLAQRENVIIVASHGLGKTMLAKNLVHQAILAGHSARFLTAADLILDLTRQETARALTAPPSKLPAAAAPRHRRGWLSHL